MSKPRLEKPAHEYRKEELHDDSLFGVGVLPTSRSGRGTPTWPIGGCCCTGCGSSQAKSIVE